MIGSALLLNPPTPIPSAVREATNALALETVEWLTRQKPEPIVPMKVTTEEIFAFLNRGQRLGVFKPCGATKEAEQSWIAALCVPSASSLPPKERSIMNLGIGIQAIYVLRELEDQYPGNSFTVAVRGTRDVAQYGYAFRDAQGRIYYKEQVSYE